MNNLLATLGTIKGARFANFEYTTRTGEVARYLVNLGVNFKKIYTDDIKTLTDMLPSLSGVDRIAAQEIITSLEKSLKSWADGKANPDSTSAHAYTNVPNIKGLKYHTETGIYHLHATVVSKETIIAVPEKIVNSSAKTIAKRRLEKMLRKDSIAQFKLQNLTRAALEGQVLTLATGTVPTAP